MSGDRKRTALITGATGGVGGAVAEALLRHGWRVRALTRRPATAAAGIDWIQGDAMRPEDLARAAEGAEILFHGANPPGYVYTTGFRLLQRAQRRHPPESLSQDGATGLPARSVSSAGVASPADSPAPTESAAVTAVAIEATLAAMPPRRRACAVMCLVTGLPVHEAAAALGIADGTVRKHLDEARQDLRDAGVAER